MTTETGQEHEDFKFIVWMKFGTTVKGYHWKPRVAGTLETVMVPCFQRGGLTGEFISVNGKEPKLELFIPWQRLDHVSTRASYEALVKHAAAAAKPDE